MNVCYFLGQRDYFDYKEELPLIANLLTFLAEDGYTIEVIDHNLTFQLLQSLQVPCTFTTKSLLHQIESVSAFLQEFKSHPQIIVILPNQILVRKQYVEVMCIIRKLLIEYPKCFSVWCNLRNEISLPMNKAELLSYATERQSRMAEFFSFVSKYDLMISDWMMYHKMIPWGKRIFVLGGGAREHAIVAKLAESHHVEKILVSPGNIGIAQESPKASNIIMEFIKENFEAILEFVLENEIDLVVVGPEEPLVHGITNLLNQNGVECFGPSKEAAKIEASKCWMKDICAKYEIPTASYSLFDDSETAKAYLFSLTEDHRVVIKADGLAAGKGVILPTTSEEAIVAVHDILDDKCFGDAGNSLVIEDYLEGEEVSVLAFTDGTSIHCMPIAQDYKRIYDDDQGLNTGGMGSYAPTPILTKIEHLECVNILQRTIDSLRIEGIVYRGVIFAGFILTKHGPQILEFNCRFGDPETQSILPLLASDLYEIMLACLNGTLMNTEIKWKPEFSCTVVCTAAGYPGNYEKGQKIHGLDSPLFAQKSVKVFHYNTIQEPSTHHVLSNGGRVIAVSGLAESLHAAIQLAYEGVGEICFTGIHYRKDIGKRVLTRPVRLGILGSTKGTSLQPIIDAIGAQTLNAKIELVISNKANSGILARSRLYGIKTLHISVNNYTREEYDDVISNELAIHDVDLVLLIGYMRILSGTFFNRFQNRCINVHPSLLPEFAGGMDLEVHKAVLEAKRKVTGCTVHLVSPKVDAGTIILQKQCNVDDNDTPESLKVKVQALEGSALIEAIRIFQENQYVPYWPTESPTTTAIDYKTAGVDIDEGEKLINLIQPFCRHTKRPGASSELGGFGGIFNLSEAGYENDETLLVAGADGVGTKLEIAQIMESHNTIGVDLVAMCANDVLVCGAEPLFFLDYFATGKLDAVVGADVVKGIAEGCQQCGMALIGGETAEMPGMYPGNSYDIAGFCVGAVKRSQLLPREVAVGDTLLGLPSSGFHSNGFSLVRKCIELHGLNYQDPGPFRSEYGTLGEALLEPTKLYPKLLLPLLEKELINGMAHITGGGITENLPRVLPTQIKAVINLAAWTLSPMFNWIQHESNLDDSNMLRTFNCGIGLILVVKPSNVPEVMQYFESLGEVVHIIGSLHDRDNEQQIEYEGNLCYVN